MTAPSNGALIVAQSGGPTAVINASLAGVIRAAKNDARIGQIIGLVNGLEGALTNRLVDLSQTSDDTLDLLANTPAAALRSGRYKVLDSDYEQIPRTFQTHNVRYFVHIGDNGSMIVSPPNWRPAAAGS